MGTLPDPILERATGQNIQDHECPKNNPKNALKQAAKPTIWLVNEVASSGFLDKPQTHRKQSGKKEGRKKKAVGRPGSRSEQNHEYYTPRKQISKYLYQSKKSNTKRERKKHPEKN